MRIPDPISNNAPHDLADRALGLFCMTYGLGWRDCFVAAAFEERYGRARCAAILERISCTGWSFAEAWQAVELADVVMSRAA